MKTPTFQENPTFQEWIDKYFTEPKFKLMYKSKMKGDKKHLFTHEDLIKRYQRAYKNY